MRYISFHVQIALDACSSVRPRDGDVIINAFVTAVREIPEKFQLGSKVRELITKFIVINADFPLTPMKEDTDARARYYADLEERRALKRQARQKAQGSKKPVCLRVSPGRSHSARLSSILT